MSGGYQQQVYNQESQGVAGDRASQNPIATFDAGPGGLVAGPNGVTVGLFAWVTAPTDPNGTGLVANNFGQGNVAGFSYNDLQALNTVFLSDGTMVIPQGLPVALATQGDFWVVNNGSNECYPGQKAYATFVNGEATFAATGTPTTGATSTGSTVTQTTNDITASISGDVLTVTAAASTIYPGAVITSGTGVTTGTAIASQLSGTTGGVGIYALTISQQKAIASEAMTLTYGLLTIGGTVTGTFEVGQVLTGTTIAGYSITANVSGSGGSGGTMATSYTGGNISSQSIGTSANVETKWYAASAAQPGGLVKITSWVGSQG